MLTLPPTSQAISQNKSPKISQKGGRLVLSYLHNYVMNLNNSKIFAGFMIIVLNIASRFVTIKLSKTMESYLKYTFSRDALVFAISWMGTRDIYIAIGITIIFMILVDYILNEESAFCCLSSQFKDYHISLMDNDKVSPDDVNKAKQVLERFENQNKREGLTTKEQVKQQLFQPYMNT